MRRNNLSRSDEGKVQIASSISRAVLINAYDTAGDRAGKGDRNAIHVPVFRIPHSAISFSSSFLLFFLSAISRAFMNSPEEIGTEIAREDSGGEHTILFLIIAIASLAKFGGSISTTI
jgi:hypothetical protein